jgi:sugar/nucleoside kinase (ribokinase family)
MYDIVTLGDSKLDVFMNLDGEAHTSCTLEREECQLILRYAEKIPVHSTAMMAAGTAMNVALGLRKLGRATGLITAFGDDAAWVLAKKTLEEHGLSTAHVHVDPHGKSSVSTILNFQGESTVLAAHETHAYPIPNPLNTQWLFIGELGDGYKPLFKTILANTQNDWRIAWNPGAIQLERLTQTTWDFLALTELLFVNHAEADRLAGKQHLPITALLSTLLELGPSTVVITRGNQGAIAGTRQEAWAIPAYTPTAFVEATGAGDAFASGFLACLAGGGHLATALAWGGALSASVVEHVGAQAGLLTHEQLSAKLAAEPLYVAHRLRL